MTEPLTPDGGPSGSPPDRLDSWKDIAAYLKRDVSTVQRWEKREGMPVHRHLHDKLGSVYAFPAELDEWTRSRRAPGEAVGSTDSQAPPAPANRRRSLWPAIAGVALIAVVAALVWWWWKSKAPENPLSNARFVRLTDFEGTEQAAAISRDGRFVAFLADRDGPVDVFVTQVGSSAFHNLTAGKVRELVNPDIRMVGFSPDGALVSFWLRRQTPNTSPDISVWAVPTLGGAPRPYVEGAAELDWSSDGTRLVYHTPGSGDPMFVKEGSGGADRKILVAPEGMHNHYPLWSPDAQHIYFVYGSVPSENDIWRIHLPSGTRQRMTSHNTRVTFPAFLDAKTLLYLATDADGSGPWLYALDTGRRASRRISFGVERYTSLSASADGRRLVVTVANPRRTLWRVPISDAVAEDAEASRVTVPVVAGRAPRVGAGYLLFVSSRNEAESIWKVAGGAASELWSATGARILGGPAIAPDGKRIAFAAEQGGRARVFVMNSDGSGVRVMPESLVPRGAPAWSPDGRSIAIAATMDGGPRLVTVSVGDQTVTSLVSDFAAEPVWSSDGTAVIYSGPEVGATFPIRSVRADGQGQPVTKMTLSRGVRRVVFVPQQNLLVVLRGEIIHKNFWAIDLDSGRERRLTNFGRDFVIGGFDVSPDGREIVFDREQDDSDVVLIERVPDSG